MAKYWLTDPQYLDNVLRHCPAIPEIDMWLSCIAQATFNAINKQDESDLAWIRSDTNKPCSFIWLCEHLQIDPDYYRQSIDLAIAGSKQVEKPYHFVKHFTERHWTADRRGLGKRTPKLKQRLRLQRN